MSDIEPLSIISLKGNENGMLPLLVLCRAPADDGWLAIEAGTAVIYNIFDTVISLYFCWKLVNGNHAHSDHADLRSRAAQARLLARAKWFHEPVGMATVGIPKRLREMAS